MSVLHPHAGNGAPTVPAAGQTDTGEMASSLQHSAQKLFKDEEYMMIRSTVVALVLVVAVPGMAVAQSKTNFSGTWNVDGQK